MSRVDQEDVNQIEEVRQALARWVCDAQVSPMSLLDKSGAFRSLADTLNPNFHSTLSLELLQQDCLKIYEEQRSKAKEIYSNNVGRISVSADMLWYEEYWHSCEPESQYCITAHFVDNDWELRKWVLKYYGDDCPEDPVLEGLKYWDIEGKVLSFTGDSYTADSIRDKIQGKNGLLLNGQLFHVQCSCDIITQMAQSAFKMIDDLIDKAKLLAWSKSLPIWHITTHKLKNVLQLEEMGEFAPGKIDEDFYEVPSAEEWEQIRIICRITDRIYEITKPLYEAKKQTANLFLPHLVEIHSYLSQESTSSEQFTRAVSQKMLKTFTMYWNDMYVMLSVAAFLDPRYKMRFIEFAFTKLRSEENAVTVLETIRKLYDSYSIENSENEYLLSDSSSESEEDYDEDEEETGKIKEKPSENVVEKLSIVKEYCSVKSENDKLVKSNLDFYMEEPVLKWTENFSVLNWWKDNCVKYPQLSKMARDFLAVPMSVASSHEAYYTDLRPADHTVVSLPQELMNALMCTRSWKFPYNDDI